MIQWARDSRPLPARGASSGSIMTQRCGKAQAGALEGWGKGPTVVLGLNFVASQQITALMCVTFCSPSHLHFFLPLFVCFWLPLCRCAFRSWWRNMFFLSNVSFAMKNVSFWVDLRRMLFNLRLNNLGSFSWNQSIFKGEVTLFGWRPAVNNTLCVHTVTTHSVYFIFWSLSLNEYLHLKDKDSLNKSMNMAFMCYTRHTRTCTHTHPEYSSP